ncbi:hypothetical protein PQ478_08935 [Alkalihalophilus pseudofirmus]|uniref:hypothetical protein n=1 Tax=Alkalihalophilus pseudofirmus TaxID=79885 RepID=UPI00259BDCE2|nr:hypothetical protein [Alkalihalophilus pseudofirmus]WEG18595.1 hypothetical protein PQ478_08935 [Alkalihalophilus pseudofirmus]
MSQYKQTIRFSKEQIEEMVIERMIEKGYDEKDLEVFVHIGGVTAYVKEDK